MIKARLLVVEDQEPTANLILQVLTAENYAARTVGTLAAARTLLIKSPPDLLILDRNLPDGDGVDLLAELRGDPRLAALPVIILTAKKDVADKISGLKTGADDYVSKPFNTEELVARVQAILRRAGKGQEQQILESAGIKLDQSSRKAWANGVPVSLSAKEFDLLWFLISRQGRVLTRDFLLEHVWGYDSDIELTTKVIDVTLSHLRAKIGPAADKIVAVRGFGYRFDG